MPRVGTRPRRVIAHLLSDLAGDARTVWDAQAKLLPAAGGAPTHLHDAIHARLGATGRSLRATRPGVPLHAAACITPDGRGLLLPGRTRAGKSTTATALAVSWQATVTSDDTVWLDEEHASTLGAPLAVREESPYREQARSLWHADDSSRLLVRPTDLGAPPMRTVGPVDVMGFLTYQTGAPAELRPISAAEAFCRLVTALLRQATDTELLGLARQAGRCPAAHLTFSDVRTSLRLCGDLIEGLPATRSTEVVPLDADELAARGCRNGVAGIRFDGDVALWSPTRCRIAFVSGWSDGSLCHTAAWDDLRSLGLVYDR